MILYLTVAALRHSLTQQLLSKTSDACRIVRKSEMIIHMVKYVQGTPAAVLTQHTGTLSVAA